MSEPDRPPLRRARLLSVILAITLGGFALAGTVTFLTLREGVVGVVDQRLNDRVLSLTPAAESAGVNILGTSPSPSPTDTPTTFTSVDEFLYNAVSRTPSSRNETSLAIIDGEAVFQPSPTDEFDLAHDPAFVADLVARVTQAEGSVFGTYDTPAGSARYVATPVQVDGSPHNGIYVHAINLSNAYAPVRDAALLYAALSALALVLMAAILWFVLRRRDARVDAPAPLPPPVEALTPTPPPATPVHAHDAWDRAEGSMEAQRQLLDDVRHELKTPITIVRGYLEIMNVNDPDDVQTAREIGISELDRMTRMVEDIDTLATVEGDEYTMGSIDIARLTARVGELVSMIPGHPWRVARVADGIIRGNPDRLLQAWLALSENAAKYTPAGSPIEIGSARTLDSMMLWVRDHGPGIPPAARHRIFRRFDRGTGKREVGGSGLGLAIVDAIARAHGGSCSVSETPGGGATFTIHIPLRLGSGASALPEPVRAGDVVQQWEATR